MLSFWYIKCFQQRMRAFFIFMTIYQIKRAGPNPFLINETVKHSSLGFEKVAFHYYNRLHFTPFIMTHFISNWSYPIEPSLFYYRHLTISARRYVDLNIQGKTNFSIHTGFATFGFLPACGLIAIRKILHVTEFFNPLMNRSEWKRKW